MEALLRTQRWRKKIAKYLSVSSTPAAEQKAAAQAPLADANSMFPKKPEAGAEEVPDPESFPVQDFIQYASYFEWAGMGFGQTESYRIHLSLKKLAVDLSAAEKPIEGLRFWGKILGTGGDYYIAETGPGESPDNDSESADLYINDYSYHVCSSAGGAWTTLPPLTSAQVVGARDLKRYFTGNLEAPVPGNPPFQGVEKNLLRAQIAEVSAASVVIPKGFFAVGDDDEGLKMEASEEEPPVMSTAQMLDSSSWEHKHLEINSLGRTMRMPEGEDEEGNPIPFPNNPDQKGALRKIGDDVDADNVWNLRVHSGVVTVRNLDWPGSATVAIPTSSLNSTPAGPGENPLGPIEFASMYVGYGIKRSLKSHTPKMPAQVCSECADPMEEAEDLLVEPEKEEEDDE